MRAAILNARPVSAAFARQWPEMPEVCRVRERFDAIGACPDRGVATARALLAEADLLNRIIAAPLAALAADPFFDPPFRVQRDAVRTTAILIDHPAARMSVSLVDADAARARGFPERFVVPGRIGISRHIHAGGAVRHQWQAGPVTQDYRINDAPPCTRLPPQPIADCDITVEDGRTQGQLIWPGERDLLTVSIVLTIGAAPLMREGQVADGRIVRAAALDMAPSHIALHLRLLRALGRADAAPLFQAATRDPAFFLRWEAMREWLMLGDAGALDRLSDMADDDPHPDVRAAARATLAALSRRAA